MIFAADGLYSAEEIEAWDQRKSLCPPPYQHGMKRFLPGVNIGDALFDKLPASMLTCHGGEADRVPQQTEPEWVDWAKLSNGQRLWLFHLSRSFSGLALSLLSGFSIARFAKVLYENGYAKDSETAMWRYMATGHAVSDWFRYSLRDHDSQARKSIYTVRAMHAFARRRSVKLFNKESGEGVPLSQLDMSEVLLGFSAVTMSFIESEIGYGDLSEADRDDMCFFWRYVGYHLGIEDEFNVCASLKTMDEALVDFMAWTPRRLETMQPCTTELRRTAIEGFALQTGLGKNFWYASFDLVFDTKRVNISHLRPEKKYLPGMNKIARFSLSLFRNNSIASLAQARLLWTRDLKKDKPEAFRRQLQIMMKLSDFHDQVIWRVLSIVYLARYFFAALFAAVFVRRVSLLYRRARRALA